MRNLSFLQDNKMLENDDLDRSQFGDGKSN